MSVKSKIIMSAAALALLGGVAAAGTPTANAATSDCGNKCTNLYPALTGPGDVLDALNQIAEAGQPITVEPASGVNPGEDFEVAFQGLVSDFVAAGLMNPGLGALYGNLPVYEIQWAPGGSPSGFCAGVEATPGPKVPVTLQPCGVTAKTTWIFDPVVTNSGSFYALFNGAADRNFQHPPALTRRSGTLDVTLWKTEPEVRAAKLWGEIVGAL